MQALTRSEITRLSPEERLTLIGQLWDSLHDSEIPLPPAQQAELSRRMASLEQDRSQAVNWEQFRAELARRCP
jgi:putative addiction module component (TIGR02574 family)